jgi:hypothetical protein
LNGAGAAARISSFFNTQPSKRHDEEDRSGDEYRLKHSEQSWCVLLPSPTMKNRDTLGSQTTFAPPA